MELYSSRQDAAPGRLDGGWLILFTLAYATALGLAAWRFWCSQMFSDYAVCGLLGQAVMRGEFPLFFYGQDFMGSLDGFLTAPLFAVFGPKTLVLAFWPPVLWLGVIFVTHRLLRLFFRPVGVFAGVFLLALPPAMLLCWAGQAQTHYPLALFLSGVFDAAYRQALAGRTLGVFSCPLPGAWWPGFRCGPISWLRWRCCPAVCF